LQTTCGEGSKEGREEGREEGRQEEAADRKKFHAASSSLFIGKLKRNRPL
jgi:predicted transposase YdaD